MRCPQEILELAPGEHVLNAHRDDNQSPINRSLHLALHLLRFVRLAAEHEHEDFCAFDPLDNRFAPVAPGKDVPRRHPASDSPPFERSAHGVTRWLIGRGVADKDIVAHWRAF